MNKKQPLDNGPLTTMFVIGGALVLIGFFVWLAAADPGESAYSSTGSGSNGVAVGGFMLGAGSMMLILGLAAQAICRQIVDTTKQGTAVDQ